MKRILLIAALLITLFTLSTQAEELRIYESPHVKIVIDGIIGDYEDVPLIVNDRTLLPLRAVLTDLGIPNDDEHIIWNPVERSVTVITEDDETTIWLKVDNYTATVNGEEIVLDAAPMIYTNDRTYIPARFISETLGKKVIWDGSRIAVLITDQERFNTIKDILAESKFATEAIENYAMDMTFNIASTSPDPFSLGILMSVVENPQQPASYAKLAVDMDIDVTTMDPAEVEEAMAAQMMLAAFLNMEIYEMPDATYSKTFLSGDGWLKTETTTSTEAVSDSLELSQRSIFPGSEDAAVAGLVMHVNPEDETIVLEGSVYMEALLNQTESMSPTTVDGADLKKYYIRYTMDHDTYEFISLKVEMIGETLNEETGQTVDLDVDILITMEPVEDDYQIDLPDDVINNIVEFDFGL